MFHFFHSLDFGTSALIEEVGFFVQVILSFCFEHVETNERFCYHQAYTRLEQQDMAAQYLLHIYAFASTHTAWTPLLALPSKSHPLSFSGSVHRIHG